MTSVPHGAHGRRPARGRSLPWLWWLSCCLAVAGGILWRIALAPPPLATLAGTPPPPAAAGPQDGDATAVGAEPPAERVELPVGAAGAPPRSYADYVDELVALGVETAARHAADDFDAARDTDTETRRVFAALMAALPDAECEALAALVAEPSATDELRAQLRRRVHRLALAAGLERRHARATAAGSRGPLDALVAAALTALPAGPGLAAEVGQGLLADRPYLGAAHEPTVLELVALAGEGRFPTPVATALLTTLWRNLQAIGARTSTELASLALLLLEDGNPANAASACRQLLNDPRYRLLVLERVRLRRDQGLAREVAMAAVQDLQPADALEVLRATVPALGDFQAPFLVLGGRAPELLRTGYEQALADNVDPALRSLLVAGAGFGGAPLGIELAQLAAGADPDPDVRVRALFVLTANAAETLGERALTAALDDPAIHADPLRLHAVVLALGNLERAGALNAIDRLGQRLRACPALPAAARAELEALLARALPGGRTSR